MSKITLTDVQDAAERLIGYAQRTPIYTSHTLNTIVGAEVFCKCENMQRTGSFKFRGAYNMISQLREEQRQRGIVSFSSGNHAQAVALVAKLLNISATIIMPNDAPIVKLAATRSYGAEVLLYKRGEQKREVLAEHIAKERGLTLIPPFNHPHIFLGQGTVALEMLTDVPDLDLLIVPLGGGGLISGCSIAAHAIHPSLRIIGIEPDSANDTYLSLQKGEIVSIPQSYSIADGLLSTAPGKLTFPIMQKHLESVELVTDEQIIEALRFLLIRMKILVEPSGSTPIAALMAGKVANVKGKKIGVVLSGGNVDPVKLAEMLKR